MNEELQEIKELIQRALLVAGLGEGEEEKAQLSTFKVVLFTDISGFTRISNKYGDSSAVELRRRHDGILKPIIKEYKGVYVKSTGDGLIALFNDPVGTVKAAVKMQRELENYNEKAEKRDQIHIRIGIHMGEVRFIDNDPIGNVVNTTERILSMKMKGLRDKDRILISETVYDDVKEVVSCRLIGYRRFKNVLGKIQVYEVIGIKLS